MLKRNKPSFAYYREVSVPNTVGATEQKVSRSDSLTLLEMRVISGQQVVCRRAPFTTLLISMASVVTDTT